MCMLSLGCLLEIQWDAEKKFELMVWSPMDKMRSEIKVRRKYINEI
jgi:hypothetical protein